MRTRVIGLVIGMAVAGFGQSWISAVDGLYSDGTKWSTGAAPVSGQNGYFNLAGSYTVSFPGGGYSDFGASEVNTGTVIFNTLDTWWLKPARAAAWGNPTFRMGGGAHGFNIENTSTKSQMLMSNAVFRSDVSGTMVSNTFVTGLFNFRNPDGIPSGNNLIIGHDSGRSHYLVFKPESEVRMNALTFRAKGKDNVILFEGGNHLFGNDFVVKNADNGTAGARVLVDVRSGTTLTISNNLVVGQNQLQTGQMIVREGAAVNVFGTSSGVASGGKGELLIDGGTMNFYGKDFKVGTSTASTGSLTLASGRLLTTGGTIMDTGYTSITQNGGAWTNTVGNYTFLNYNSPAIGTDLALTINEGSFDFGASALTLGRGIGSKVRFTVNGGNVRIGGFSTSYSAGNDTAADFNGGTVYLGGLDVGLGGGAGSFSRVTQRGSDMTLGSGLTVATANNSTGVLEIIGGTLTNTAGSVRLAYGGGANGVAQGNLLMGGGNVYSTQFLNIGDNGTAEFRMTNGVWEQAANTITVGNNKGAQGSFIFSGGSFIPASGTTLTLGNNSGSFGRFIQDGGEFAISNYLSLGTYAGASGVFSLSNGVFTATNANWFVGNALGSTGQVVVAGGTLRSYSSQNVGHKGYGRLDVSGGLYEQVSGSFLVGNNNGSVGDIYVTGGKTVAFGGMTVGNGNGGTGGATGTVYITGGELVSSNVVIIGNNNNSSGRLVIDGGTLNIPRNRFRTALTALSTGSLELVSGALITKGFNIGESGSSEVKVRGGVWTNYGGDNIFMNYGGGNSRMEVSGGSLNFATANDFNIGRSGGCTSELIFSGGTHQFRNIIPGYGGSVLLGRMAMLGGEVSAVDVKFGTAGVVELNGGTLRPNRILGNDSVVKGRLSADGGTLTPATSGQILVSNLQTAELGSSGLTIDTAGINTTVNQAFTDKAGVDGLLVKRGEGVLTLSGTSTHSQTRVQGGTLTLASGSTAGRNLAVDGYGILSAGGAFAADSFTLGSQTTPGTLVITNNNTISVGSGGISLPYAKIQLGTPAQNGEYVLFNAAGTVPQSIWEQVDIINALPDKGYVMSTRANGGTTDLVLSILDKSEMAIGESIWTGSAGSAWETAGNWDAAQPQAGERAVFGDSAAVKSVTVGPGAIAGALKFTGTLSYTIGGSETLSLDYAGMPAVFSASAGSHTITAPVQTARTLLLSPEDGAQISVDGTLSGHGGVRKVEKGTALLRGQNTYLSGVVVEDGRLAFTSPGALGASPGVNDNLQLIGGTLQSIVNPIVLDRGLLVDAGASTKSVVLDTQSDLTVRGTPSVRSGAIIKRGPGVLTFEVSGNTILTAGNGLSVGNGMPPVSGVVEFPAGGSSPTNGFAGFCVAEGLVRIKGDTSSKVTMQNVCNIGMQTATGTVSPGLEFDGVTAQIGGGSMATYVGNWMPAESSMTKPYFGVVNGAQVTTDTFNMGSNSKGTVSPELYIGTNSLLYITYNTAFANQASTGKAKLTVDGGILRIQQIDANFNAPFEMSIVNGGALEAWGTQVPTRGIVFQSGCSGTFNVQNGGALRFRNFRMESTAGVTLTFDGGIYQPLQDGLQLFRYPAANKMVTVGNGLTAVISNGFNYVMSHPITGSGGLTKTGPGTLVFGPGAEQTSSNLTNFNGLVVGSYDGSTAVQEGTLAVSNGTIRTDMTFAVSSNAVLELSSSAFAFKTISGAGTVRNGSLTDTVLDSQDGELVVQNVTLTKGVATCAVEQNEAGVVTPSQSTLFDGLLPESLTVNLARGGDNKLKIPCGTFAVARYTNLEGAPDVSKWKLTGTGDISGTGDFMAQDGVVYVTPRFSGTFIILK